MAGLEAVRNIRNGVRLFTPLYIPSNAYDVNVLHKASTYMFIAILFVITQNSKCPKYLLTVE